MPVLPGRRRQTAAGPCKLTPAGVKPHPVPEKISGVDGGGPEANRYRPLEPVAGGTSYL
jgi:hypothetical protein